MKKMDALKQTMFSVTDVCAESLTNMLERMVATKVKSPHKNPTPEWTYFALMETALKNVRARMKKMPEMVQTMTGAPRSVILENA